MEIVPPNMVSVNEFKVESLNLDKKAMAVSFGYILGSSKAKVSKILSFDENVVNFVLGCFSEIKQSTSKKIEKEEEMKEKLVNTVTRVIKEVEGLKKFKDASQYMRAYNKIHCYRISFPEIEI